MFIISVKNSGEFVSISKEFRFKDIFRRINYLSIYNKREYRIKEGNTILFDIDTEGNILLRK